MRLLFLHQNMPGQYRHLIRHLSREGHEILFVTQPEKPAFPGIGKVEYTPHREPTKGIHPYLHQTERAVINGQGVVRALISLKGKGYQPDVIIGHPGWGETLFVKDIYPDTPLLSYCEFYYCGRGSDVGFDPEFAQGVDTILRARARAAYHLLSLDIADVGISPTEWQKSQFPKIYHDRIRVIHDGINTATVAPDPSARFDLGDGRSLGIDDEVITYVARNLEPYRGFHCLMRALPAILERRPEAQIVVVGGDEVSYGSAPKDGRTWRDVMMSETGLASDRVHFTGRIPYGRYLNLLRVSTVHVYLTYPFVLSWSALEAMAAGCCLVASNTPPVTEVIAHERNGLLVDFFDTGALADMVVRVCADPGATLQLREAARRTVTDRFDLSRSLGAQTALIEEMASG